MTSIRKELRKLASEHPELKTSLTPLLKKAARSQLYESGYDYGVHQVVPKLLKLDDSHQKGEIFKQQNFVRSLRDDVISRMKFLSTGKAGLGKLRAFQQDAEHLVYHMGVLQSMLDNTGDLDQTIKLARRKMAGSDLMFIEWYPKYIKEHIWNHLPKALTGKKTIEKVSGFKMEESQSRFFFDVVSKFYDQTYKFKVQVNYLYKNSGVAFQPYVYGEMLNRPEAVLMSGDSFSIMADSSRWIGVVLGE